MSDPAALLNSEQSRRQVVKLALALTENTPLSPKDYERMLLEQFVRGEMTIEQVIDLLESNQK